MRVDLNNSLFHAKEVYSYLIHKFLPSNFLLNLYVSLSIPLSDEVSANMCE